MSPASILVNPVNCVGVMGKGLAKQFKKKFPEMYLEYHDACRHGKLVIGKLHVYYEKHRFIINFPTQVCWNKPSELDYIAEGLDALIACLLNLQEDSIAIPALGCGCGELDWTDVKQLIEYAIRKFPIMDVYLYEPL